MAPQTRRAKSGEVANGSRSGPDHQSTSSQQVDIGDSSNGILSGDPNKSEGILTFKVEKCSEIARETGAAERFGCEYTYIQGIPWRLSLKKSSDTAEPQFTEVRLTCDPKLIENDAWSCEVSATFKILPKADGVAPAKKKARLQESSSSTSNGTTSSSSVNDVRQFHHIFNYASKSHGVRYPKFEELVHASNGWYDHATDTITIEAVVKAKMPRGVGFDVHNQLLSDSKQRGLKLFESGKFSDFVIRFVDPNNSENNKDFHVHKFVLASHSDVFGAMFSNQDAMKYRESRVEIVDSTARAIHQMLHFMYAGKLPNELQGEDAVELLKLAHKYQIEHLALVSEEKLMESVTLENVCDLLPIADRHSAQSLRIACCELIRKDLDRVKEQAKWAALKKSAPGLVIRVLEESAPRRRVFRSGIGAGPSTSS